MKLCIGTPTHGLWTPEMGHSLAWTMASLAMDPGEPSLLHHVWVDGTLLPALRIDIAKHALEIGATHILWVDDDMKFKPDNVRALLKHDLDIVAANYLRRKPPHNSVAVDLDGKNIEPKTGLEQVAHVGMGLMLTKTSVFERIEQPWFMMPWSTQDKDFIGEDVWFCSRARMAGIDVWIDHDASYGVGHVSKQILTLERAGAVQ